MEAVSPTSGWFETSLPRGAATMAESTQFHPWRWQDCTKRQSVRSGSWQLLPSSRLSARLLLTRTNGELLGSTRWQTSRVRPAGTRSLETRALFSGAGTGPLIPASDTWGIWTVLLACAAGGFWSEKTEIGKRLSGPLVATLLGLVASNGGIIPCEAPAFLAVNMYLMPLAVPLLLFGADLRRVLRDSGRLLLAFLLGAGGTIIGTLVALKFLPLRSLGEDGWKIAAALMSRHIGGAVNYVAVSEALGVSSSVVTAGLAADNLICAIYFTSLFALASGIPPDPPNATSSQSGDIPQMEDSRAAIGVLETSTALALSAALCTLGASLAKAVSFRGGMIPCTTFLVVLMATLFPSWVGGLAASGEGMAAILMQIFFASVGANGSVDYVIRTAPALFIFSFIQIAVHLALILGVGRILGFERRELLLASNANVGGPTTGAGMATAKGWRTLLVPTILVGIFGYSIATFLSIVLGQSVLRKMTW